jgi:hypothetical protein
MRARGKYLRWLYEGGRPNAFARAQNRLGALAFGAGLLPRRAGALVIRGRRSGKPVSFPIVIADYEGDRYVVSMLGSNTNWVRNLEAAGGTAELRHGRREPVSLVAVAPERRAPILRRYLALAPGARPHFPVERHAPIEDFAAIAADYPVYRIEPRRLPD